MKLKRGWDDERCDVLDRLWQSGASLEEMKAQLGASSEQIGAQLFLLGHIPSSAYPSRYWHRFQKKASGGKIALKTPKQHAGGK